MFRVSVRLCKISKPSAQIESTFSNSSRFAPQRCDHSHLVGPQSQRPIQLADGNFSRDDRRHRSRRDVSSISIHHDYLFFDLDIRADFDDRGALYLRASADRKLGARSFKFVAKSFRPDRPFFSGRRAGGCRSRIVVADIDAAARALAAGALRSDGVFGECGIRVV